jgi:hypothetical protein
MGPTDSKRPVQPAHVPGHGGPLAALGHLAAAHADTDTAFTSSCPADALDGFGVNWEAAWIDLGGEG